MSNKRLKKRSEVWKHFDETSDGQRAICKYCANNLSGNSKGGTSHLKRHLESCKNHLKRDVNQPMTLASTNEARNIGLTHHQIAEVKKAVLAEIPFASPDHKKSWYSLMGSMDIEKEICAYYKHKKEKLANELTSRVCFSLEIPKYLSYIFIIAHYVDEDFNLVRKLVGFKRLTDVSTESCIDAIKCCINDWKLQDKIFSFIRNDFWDNRLLEERMKKEFSSKMLLNGKFIEVLSCTGNVKFFNHEYIRPLISTEKDNIEEFVKYLKTFPSQMDTFNNIARERGLPPIKMDWLNEYSDAWYEYDNGFLQHVPIKMFKEAIIYKDVFSRYGEIAVRLMTVQADQLENGNSSCLCPPTEIDHPSLSKSNTCNINWKRVEGLFQFSHVASKIINGLCASNCPTSNFYFPNVVEIEDVVLKIYHDFYNNWWSLLDGNSGKLFEVANALDPRYKLTFSEYYWNRRSDLDIESRIDDNKKFLEEVFSAYAKEDINEASPAFVESSSTKDHGSLSTSTLLCSRTIYEFSMFIKEKQKNKRSELDKYLDDELEVLDDTSFNLLAWWKQNRSRYPVLSRMARDILAVPTCVCSMKHIITSDFTVPEGVSPELVEAVICIKDWILSKDKVNSDYTHWEMYAIGGNMNPTIISQGNCYIAPPDINAKEVTKRAYTLQSEWQDWVWKSDGDLMSNGAFFIQSGRTNVMRYSRKSFIKAKPGTYVKRLTRFSGALGCKRNQKCRLNKIVSGGISWCDQNAGIQYIFNGDCVDFSYMR